MISGQFPVTFQQFIVNPILQVSLSDTDPLIKKNSKNLLIISNSMFNFLNLVTDHKEYTVILLSK